MNTEIERKFLIEMPDEGRLSELGGAVRSEIIQTYLISTDGSVERVRRRDYGDHVVYYHTRKKRISALSAFEDESEITETEYDLLLERADKSKKPIVKTRWAIPFCGHVAEIDVYPFWKHQAVLEIEQEDEQIEIPFPPYLSLIREVTGDHAYSNNRLSERVPEEELFAFTKYLSHFSGRPTYDGSGDIFVMKNGSDKNDGSRERPFATIERAVKEVRARKESGKRVTVAIGAGRYETRGIELNEEDSGFPGRPVTYRPLGDGEVILSGAIRLRGSDFDTADGRVYTYDLGRLGDDMADAGTVYCVGCYGGERKYDSYREGVNREVYLNGKRLVLARYPKEGYLRLGPVYDAGDCLEFPVHTHHPDWAERRNHRAGEYGIDSETAQRVASWKHTDDIHAFGFFSYDWADGSTPVKKFDLSRPSFKPEYVSMFGAYEGHRYYFYNVPDELSEGQYYVDKQSKVLCLCPGCDMKEAFIDIGGRTADVIHMENIHDVTFEGITIDGGRGNGIRACGTRIVLNDLIVRNMSENGIVLTGYDHLVRGCELYSLGRGGILLDGGIRETLVPGNNLADNNSIHGINLIYPVYQPGIALRGVGNRATHNEIYDVPHFAISYGGNDHVIRFNVIHDAVKQATDAGAIYAGRDWAAFGTEVSDNCLYRIGDGEFEPDGIYFDDALSGQTARRNLLVDVKKYGFIVGGGRHNVISGNVIAVCGKSGIDFDDRCRDAYVGTGWAKHMVCGYDKVLWKNLGKVPYQSEIWSKKYPDLAAIKTDDSDTDDPAFACNPAGSEVTGNFIICDTGRHMRVFPSVFEYSKIEENQLVKSCSEARIPYGEFTGAGLNLGKMGRY